MNDEQRIKITYVATSNLGPNPWNPNRQDDLTREKERRSIKAHGFVDPITVRSLGAKGDDGSVLYEIIDGEHRWLAAKDLGIESVPCVNLGAVPDAQAKRLTVKLNELRGQADAVKLAELFRELAETSGVDALAEELPYSQVAIESLIKSISDFEWDKGAILGAAKDTIRQQGEDAKVQIGKLKGEVPQWLAQELMEEWGRTSERIRSRAPENILKNWLERLRASAKQEA